MTITMGMTWPHAAIFGLVGAVASCAAGPEASDSGGMPTASTGGQSTAPGTGGEAGGSPETGGDDGATTRSGTDGGSNGSADAADDGSSSTDTTGSVGGSCREDPPSLPGEFSDYSELAFCDGFETFAIQHPTHAPDGRWTTTFHWGSPDPASGADGDRTLFNNPEDEWYVSEFYSPGGVAAVDPFANVQDMGRSVLRIRAEPAPATMLPHMGGHNYTSGMLSSRASFNHQYGFSVVRVRLPGPAGSEAGTWPSAWWVASDGQWPPEFDLFDNALGAQAWVSAAPGDVGILFDTLADLGHDTVDFSADYHEFGFGWTPDTISWWLDGDKIREAPTPASYHQSMFFLLTFAIGAPGAWDGNAEVEPSTVFPADLFIDGIWFFQVP